MIACLCALPSVMEAQSKKKKSKKDDDDFKSHLWYGGGLNLGGGFLGGGGSAFAFGIAPMVGYKFFGPLSAGPRASINLASYKIPGAKALTLVDTELGAFLRIKVFRGLFVQGELTNEWEQEQEFPGALTKIKYTRFNQYAGAGWNFSGGRGGASQEIGIFYNFAVNNDLRSFENPWEYRLAFTFNF